MTDTKEQTEHVSSTTSDTASDADARELAAVGKKSVLRVRLTYSHRPLQFLRSPLSVHLPLTRDPPAQLPTPRHPRRRMRLDGNMGRLSLRLRLCAPQRRSWRDDLRLLTVLGGLGGCLRYHV